MAKNIDFMGATFPDVPSIRLPQHEGGLVAFDDTTDATATADKILQGYTAYANGQKLVGTASGGITPSGTYSITSNGIYDIVSFASVDVNVSGGGGGDHDAEDGIIDRTISGVYENSRVTSVGSYAFYDCQSITTASFPNVTNIGSSAFYGCSRLTTVSFPNAKSLALGAFRSCQALTDADFPNVEAITGGVFSNCYSLSRIILPKVQSITTGAFQKCFHLMEVRLDSVSAVPSCPNAVITFSSTPIGGYSASTGSYGSVYVPASLYDSFLADTNWKMISKRIVSVGV